MSDSYTDLNPASVAGGSRMDETGVDYSGNTRHRPRVVLSGEDKEAITEVMSSDPSGSEYGMITRQIHSPYPGTSVCDLQSATLIGENTPTTIWTYTVEAGKRFHFLGYVGSSATDGDFELSVDNVPAMGSRTTAATLTTQVSFAYSPFAVSEGETIRLKFTHYKSVLTTGRGTVIGYLVDL